MVPKPLVQHRPVSALPLYSGFGAGTAVDFAKSRIGKVRFNCELPSTTDAMLVTPMDLCAVLRLIILLDEAFEEHTPNANEGQIPLRLMRSK